MRWLVVVLLSAACMLASDGLDVVSGGFHAAGIIGLHGDDDEDVLASAASAAC
jgi:hypothetical protein